MKRAVRVLDAALYLAVLLTANAIYLVACGLAAAVAVAVVTSR